MKALVSQLLPEMGYWIKKKSLKLEQQNEFVLQGTLDTFLPVKHMFTRIFNGWLQKPAKGNKPLDLGSRF